MTNVRQQPYVKRYGSWVHVIFGDNFLPLSLVNEKPQKPVRVAGKKVGTGFPLFMVEKVLGELQEFQPYVDESISSYVMEKWDRAISVSIFGMDDIQSPKCTLMDSQKEALWFENRTDGLCIIGDKAGAGKTLSVLGFPYSRKLNSLVVCPGTATIHWHNEITDKLDWFKPEIFRAGDDLDDVPDDCNILITNYEQAHKMPELVKRLHIDQLILDEAHWLKSRGSARTRAINNLRPMVKYVIMATANPAHDRPKDIWSLLNILKPGEFCSFSVFATRYADPQIKTIWDRNGRRRKVRTFDGIKHEDELRDLLSSYLIRRDYDVGTKQIRIPYPIELKPADMKKLLEIDHVSTMRSELGALKAGIMKDMIKDHANQGRPIVVFSCYKKAVKLLSKLPNTFLCTGDQTVAEREENRLEWSKSKNGIFLVTYKAGAENINLTAGTQTFLIDIPFLPKDIQQAEARTHRKGQQFNCTYYYPYASGTYDKKALSILLDKVSLIEKMGIGTSEEVQAIQEISEESYFNEFRNKRNSTEN